MARRRWPVNVLCFASVLLSIEFMCFWAFFKRRQAAAASKYSIVGTEVPRFLLRTLQPTPRHVPLEKFLVEPSPGTQEPKFNAGTSKLDHVMETVFWNATLVKLKINAPKHRQKRVRIMHISDSHMSLSSYKPPYTDRMHNEYVLRRNFFTNNVDSPMQFFKHALDIAVKARAVVALGGDIVNFPAADIIEWVLHELHSRALDFCYITGNHDWMTEGAPVTPTENGFAAWASSERQAGILGSLSLLRPSLSGVSTRIIGGLLRLIAVDNSVYGVTPQQLAEFQTAIKYEPELPAVLLLHIPLWVQSAPARLLFPLMGAPEWGADADRWFKAEKRPRWPHQAERSTAAFLSAVRAASAPAGPLVAILSGHVHQNVTFPVNCEGQCAAKWRNGWSQSLDISGQRERVWEREVRSSWPGAMQHVTLDGSDGGYRLFEFEFV